MKSVESGNVISPTSLKARPIDANIGTLWVMRHSSISIVVKIVLQLSARTARQVTHIPLISTLTMYARLLWHGKMPPVKLTAPVLKTLDERPNFILDSFSIAQYIDMHRLSRTPSLFPVSHMDEINTFNEHAQTLLSYMRATMMSRLKSDLSTAEALFAPRWMHGKPWFTRPLLRIMLWLFTMKYARESRRASLENTRRALMAVRSALMAHAGEDLRYLVAGRLTYADIVITEMISFDTERYPKYTCLYADASLADEFADVIAWTRALRDTHGLNSRTR